MQNVNIVSRPKFHAISNGALVFAVSIIHMYQVQESG
jgi:hypothetical protein